MNKLLLRDDGDDNRPIWPECAWLNTPSCPTISCTGRLRRPVSANVERRVCGGALAAI